MHGVHSISDIKQRLDRGNDPLGGSAIPHVRHILFADRPGDLLLDILQGVELVGVLGDGPFGVGSQGEAGDVQIGDLFL